MLHLFFILLVSSLGGTVIIYIIKNLLLGEKLGFGIDWDGTIERAVITFILIYIPIFWPILPLVIAVKILWHLIRLKGIRELVASREPGMTPQKINIKIDLMVDFCVSPAFAILCGVFG